MTRVAATTTWEMTASSSPPRREGSFSEPGPGAPGDAPGLPAPTAAAGGAPDLAVRAGQVAGEWAPAVARILLGLVLAWFGYHELVQPSLWTGYVPLVPAASGVAVLLVLAHGWLLLILAVALIAGIAPRAAAAAAAVLLLEIVIWLTASGRTLRPDDARRGRARARAVPDRSCPASG